MKFLTFFVVTLFFFDATANQLTNRIVGGHPAHIASFPYMASLRISGHHTCGAALIAPAAVLTAAHCIEHRDARAYSVQLNATYRQLDEGQVRRVARIILHPAFDARTFAADIAIVRLAAPVAFGAGVRAVALPRRRASVRPGTGAWVAGWGVKRHTWGQGAASEGLQAVQLPVWKQIDCVKAQTFWTYIDEKMFCAGFKEGGKDSCQGDSGGPLVANGILWGIVSHGRGCAGRNKPGVYTNVVKFLDFIEEHVNIRVGKF